MSTGDLTETQQLAVIGDRVRAMHDEQKALSAAVQNVSEQLHKMEIEQVGSDATLKSSTEAAHRRIDELKVTVELVRAETQREVAARDRLLTEMSKGAEISKEQQTRLLTEQFARAIAEAQETQQEYAERRVQAIRSELGAQIEALTEQVRPMAQLVFTNRVLIFLVGTLVVAVIGAIATGQLDFHFHP